jgi:hypothetical protein
VNEHLEMAKAELERARAEVRDLRQRHNAAVDRFNAARSRVEHLAVLNVEAELELARARRLAIAEGKYALASWLVSR